MAHVHDDTTGAEHPGFLQKLKDKLHIGHHHKDKEATTPEAAVSSKSTTATDAANVPSPPPVKEEPAIAKPEAAPAAAPVEEAPHHPTTDLNSLTGHEAEHHGGVPTFLAALPDQDMPSEATKEKLHHMSAGETATGTSDVGGGEFFDSEEVFTKAQQGEHHEGVPTFLVALPDQDMPDEQTKEKLHHVSAGEPHSSNKEVDSEELFSNAQEGEHHGGVPTFLVALPDQEIPEEVNKGVSTSDSGDKEEFDSEEVFSKAQEGEHHEGVPTFLVALPDQDLPDEETKEKLHHVSAEEGTKGVDAA